MSAGPGPRVQREQGFREAALALRGERGGRHTGEAGAAQVGEPRCEGAVHSAQGPCGLGKAAKARGRWRHHHLQKPSSWLRTLFPGNGKPRKVGAEWCPQEMGGEEAEPGKREGRRM